jgi:hypothetical protein
MAPLLQPTESAAWQQLLAAQAGGKLRLVDADARPLTLATATSQQCWAHLTDAASGQVHVHEFTSSRELLKPQYLELLGLNV